MKDKTVIVTGAARGLGQKYALELSKAGALVVAADINSCEETKKFDEDFDVKNILTPEVDNYIVKRSLRNTKSLKTRKSYQKKGTFFLLTLEYRVQ